MLEVSFFMTTREHIEEVLNTTIRPALARHRGGLEVVHYDDEAGVLYVALQGMCQGCPAAELTVKGGIEMELKERIPGLNKVESVTR